eukprot:CAMPEP_0206560154 /NCGR_PEP_ID=MMETSP0325_2-20121206/20835_1 /ASSEMBLY_ACC=CAM_ASM_000347 /TAXON_ID=2866 /ORGANISM="Crypthecodinium cohnii, Strain Seligo" /LENGTH=196 /DNA_ID=CAMNT_0054061821 /DNA_START=69 /DNA_END=655 /DNA_ORIENTATION=+
MTRRRQTHSSNKEQHKNATKQTRRNEEDEEEEEEEEEERASLQLANRKRNTTMLLAGRRWWNLRRGENPCLHELAQKFLQKRGRGDIHRESNRSRGRACSVKRSGCGCGWIDVNASTSSPSFLGKKGDEGGARKGRKEMNDAERVDGVRSAESKKVQQLPKNAKCGRLRLPSKARIETARKRARKNKAINTLSNRS